MVDKEMTALEKDIQQKLSEPPEASPVRNINYDVHQGHAAQRPYARLEDQMAPLTQWRSFEQLAAALEGTADGPIYKDDAGDWFHKKKVEAAGMLREEDGQVMRALKATPRRVALTREAAIAGTDNGVHTDYYNGFSWVWDGKKSARDHQVMAQMANQTADEDLIWEPLDPMAQIDYRAQQSRMGMAFPVAPKASHEAPMTAPKATKEGDK